MLIIELFQLIDDVLEILKIPLESKSRLVFPDEILLHRLYCIRAMIPMMDINHIEIIKNMSLELMQHNLKDNSKSEVIEVKCNYSAIIER